MTKRDGTPISRKILPRTGVVISRTIRSDRPAPDRGTLQTKNEKKKREKRIDYKGETPSAFKSATGRLETIVNRVCTPTGARTSKPCRWTAGNICFSACPVFSGRPSRFCWLTSDRWHCGRCHIGSWSWTSVEAGPGFSGSEHTKSCHGGNATADFTRAVRSWRVGNAGRSGLRVPAGGRLPFAWRPRRPPTVGQPCATSFSFSWPLSRGRLALSARRVISRLTGWRCGRPPSTEQRWRRNVAELKFESGSRPRGRNRTNDVTDYSNNRIYSNVLLTIAFIPCVSWRSVTLQNRHCNNV